jgi:ATP-binding cassette subfamily F protein 3
MSVLTASRLAKSYGALDVFENVSVEIPHGAKIALVGPNGAGKTTLLRLLVGRESPTQGTVTCMRGLRIGFLPQEAQLPGERTLWDEMLTAFADLRALEGKLRALEAQMANRANDELMERYGELQARFEGQGGYDYELQIRLVLEGLGFDREADFKRPLAQLSGGQKTRALLARLLLERPDLLVLDEPANHLDLKALEWLEAFLVKWEGALLLVSHDRYFMDRVVNVVWELNWGQLQLYHGNYSHYAQQRGERHARLLVEYQAQQEHITKEQEYIRRNIAGQNTRQAQGRRKRLARFMRDEAISRPRQDMTMRLRLQTELRSGDKVLMTRGLVVGYAEDPAPLFTPPDITLYRGEVAALIGPNGVGKTTFLKTVMGELPPLGGESRLGASVRVGYFAQGHEDLNPDRTILEEILAVQNLPISQARHYLGRFLFQGDDVFKPISALSGGERGRVALARLALSGANLLLLDEPTNHLDIPSQEILQAVLADFDGTILLVSHDRYLIDALATQIWALDEGKLVVFEGPYQEYLQARSQGVSDKRLETSGFKPLGVHAESQLASEPKEPGGKKARTRGKSNGRPEKPRLSPYARARRIREVEDNIDRLEVRLVELSGELGQAGGEGDVERVRVLGDEYAAVEARLQASLEEWESLMER